MRWFKHLSAARNDERIADLEDRAGLEGYGFFFKMLEIVAEAMDNSDKCDATFSVSRWARQVNVTTKKFLFLVQCCADVGLMSVQCQSDVSPISSRKITVKIPKLLKYKDDFSKKSGQTRDNVRHGRKNEDINNNIYNNINNINKELTPLCISPLNEHEQVGIDTSSPVAYKTKATVPKTSRAARKTPLPTDFGISDAVRKWALERGYDRLEDRLEAFIIAVKAKGYTYIDWDAAFKKSIRDDWARLSQPPNKPQQAFMDTSKKDFSGPVVRPM